MNKVAQIARKIGFILAIIIGVPILIVVGLALLALVITTWYAIAGIVMFILVILVLRQLWVDRKSTPDQQ
jgi:uncharacterized membrane protein